LARHFGCGPSHGCPIDYPFGEFDKGWQLKYVYDPPMIYSEAHYNSSPLLSASSSSSSSKHPFSLSYYSGKNERRSQQPSSVKTELSVEKNWGVYGTVVDMNFDPLCYSKTAGDYTSNGTDSGGNWILKN